MELSLLLREEKRKRRRRKRRTLPAKESFFSLRLLPIKLPPTTNRHSATFFPSLPRHRGAGNDLRSCRFYSRLLNVLNAV